MNKKKLLDKARALPSHNLARCLELKFRRQKRELENIPLNLRTEAQRRQLKTLTSMAKALSN